MYIPKLYLAVFSIYVQLYRIREKNMTYTEQKSKTALMTEPSAAGRALKVNGKVKLLAERDFEPRRHIIAERN